MSYIGIPPFGQTVRTITTVTASAGQTTFNITGGYVVGYVDVFLNGVLLNPTDYTATDGLTVVLDTGAALDDEFQAVSYQPIALTDTYRKAESDARYQPTATGTPDGTKFLGDDNSWQSIVIPSVSPSAVSDQANTSTGYFDLPAGNTDERPGSPAAGMVRFNTEIGEPEWYDPATSQWLKFSQASQYIIEYLIVAGGGSGGSGTGGGQQGNGGGGAGGLLSGTYILTPGSLPETITVGLGGASVSGASFGINGANSSAFGFTAIGGGGGAGNVNQQGVGLNGGSGGGGSGSTGGLGTLGQGNNGGSTTAGGGSGGGGAFAAGGDADTGNTGGVGGAGLQWLDGNYYAGGGAGATYDVADPVSGGIGGGGAGGSGTVANGTAGQTNTGGGGGAGNNGAGGGSTGSSGAGGSGIVIIRYAGAQRGVGGFVTSSNGYTYHTFTSSGTFTA